MYESAVEVDVESIDVEELGLYLVLTTEEKELQNDGMRDHCRLERVRKGGNRTSQVKPTVQMREDRLCGNHPPTLTPVERC